MATLWDESPGITLSVGGVSGQVISSLGLHVLYSVQGLGLLTELPYLAEP